MKIPPKRIWLCFHDDAWVRSDKKHDAKDVEYVRAGLEAEGLEDRLQHCDGADCTCAARCESDCVCNADWTSAEIYILRAQAAGAV